MMKRRQFITLLGGAAAWPLAVRAQQPAMPVIGFLNTGSPDLLPHHLAVFRQALSETGFVEGRNAVVEYRWARGRYDRLPTLATELVHGNVGIIVANGPAVPVAKRATNTIPIVFVTGVDPVGTGLVASLNHPGGNLTGVTTLDVQLGPKLLEVLHQVMPNTARVAVLVNPANPAGPIQARDHRFRNGGEVAGDTQGGRTRHRSRRTHIQPGHVPPLLRLPAFVRGRAAVNRS
jgi:putative tryptophan/tyrosine transport system substrate-binding protein